MFHKKRKKEARTTKSVQVARRRSPRISKEQIWGAGCCNEASEKNLQTLNKQNGDKR